MQPQQTGSDHTTKSERALRQYDAEDLVDAAQIALDADTEHPTADNPTQFPLPNNYNLTLPPGGLAAAVNLLHRKIKEECRRAAADPKLRNECALSSRGRRKS